MSRILFGSFIVTLILITAYKTVLSEPTDYEYAICYEGPTFNNNSEYKRNLEKTLTVLPSTNTGYGFFTSSTGEGDNVVNGTALCYGEIYPDTCLRCLNDLILMAREMCPNNMGAFVYNDNCTLNYFNKHLNSSLHAIFRSTSQSAISDSHVLKTHLMSLLKNIITVAASGSVLRKFASDNITAPNSTTVYGSVQCNPDQSQEGCTQCLDGAVGLFYPSNDSSNKASRGIVILTTCNFRYEVTTFYETSNKTMSPPLPTKGKNNTVTIVLVTVTVCVTIIASTCIFLRMRKKHNENALELLTSGVIEYDFKLVKFATNGFSDDAKLGQGGFGAVYRGKLEGADIAVKRLHRSTGGEQEFKNEVDVLGRIVHRNLVKLLGYCIKGNERLLVFEYLPNGSLDRFVTDSSRRDQLDWEKRFNIITGIIRGLVYLHQETNLQIIHRDMKPGNILLDEQLHAKIADFGLARVFRHGEIERDTSHIVGTRAYMPPEYVNRGHFSEKTDVYSFGILLLEIIGGQMRRNHCYSNGDTIISHAWRHWQNKTLTNVIDPLMTMGQDAPHQVMKCIHIGLLCVQENDGVRPTSREVEKMIIESGNPNQTIPSPIN